MPERTQHPDYLQPDLNKIGIMQLNNRHWIFGDHHLTKLDWRDISELDALGDIQNRVWKFGERNIVPPNILAIIEETGGHLLSATDKNGETEAFVLTLATKDPNKLFLHMVAVDPEKQSTGVGLKIMQLEGAIARSEGVKTIEWTYDPLQGGNSQLYISKLGARPYKYTINKYGIVKNTDTHSESRYKDVPTDRFTVKWNIGDSLIWNIATGALNLNPSLNGIPEWRGKGIAPAIFQIPVVFDFTQLTTEEMMQERVALREIALKTLDIDNFSNRNYSRGTHEVVAFVKDTSHTKNHYIFNRKTS